MTMNEKEQNNIPIATIMNGQIWDTWNSENGSIGTVWVKAF